eukprot:comp44208_c0_seq1/m.47509 comp44208_c0_seq1/g.47509  ORF comp44208_c0_seq1/g.47509 comp44208_c0_seq1/m.47509 type:complete len:346 (-) comp44208_c0_seq1:496-1533(-)
MSSGLRNRGEAASGEPALRTAIVTGANTGIGKETAWGLAASGQYDLVILACRSKDKAEEAIKDIKAQLPSDCPCALEYMHVELSNMSSVRQFADAIKTHSPPLKLTALVNNAGLASFGNKGAKVIPTADGFEPLFATNFLSHFLLTMLLLDMLKSAGQARIVNLSSVMHRRGASKLALYEKGLTEFSGYSYANSKMAMVLFTTHLHSILQGSGVEVHAVNPGAVNSDIWRSIPIAWMLAVAKFIFSLIFLTPRQGAATSIHAATAPGIGSNKYWTPYWIPIRAFTSMFDHLSVFVGAVEADPRPDGRDPVLAKGLFDACWEAVKLEGNPPCKLVTEPPCLNIQSC